MNKENPYYDPRDNDYYDPAFNIAGCCENQAIPSNPSKGCPPDATEAAPDTRANVEGFLLYIQGYQDALVVFSSMLEEVIGE